MCIWQWLADRAQDAVRDACVRMAWSSVCANPDGTAHALASATPCIFSLCSPKNEIMATTAVFTRASAAANFVAVLRSAPDISLTALSWLLSFFFRSLIERRISLRTIKYEFGPLAFPRVMTRMCVSNPLSNPTVSYSRTARYLGVIATYVREIVRPFTLRYLDRRARRVFAACKNSFIVPTLIRARTACRMAESCMLHLISAS